MNNLSIFLVILVIGFGIAVLISDNSQDYRPSGCYKRSYYRCGNCRRTGCRYHKMTKTLERMEEDKYE